VPQDVHGDAGMNVERSEQRRAGVAGGVHGDPTDTHPVASRLEATVEVPRLERRPVSCREDEAGLLPNSPRRRLAPFLVLPAKNEARRAQIIREADAEAARDGPEAA
jgi:hypothetical protein